MKYFFFIGAVLLFIFSGFWGSARAAGSLDVIVNEIAWMGTETSYNDEWIELYNNTGADISLDGWFLKANDGTPEISLAGIIKAGSFYLLERTDDTTVLNISADLIYKGALGNEGERLLLYDNSGSVIDELNCVSNWCSAGDNSTKQTMERKNPNAAGSNLNSWQTSQYAGGTPKAENSPGAAIPQAISVSEESAAAPLQEPQQTQLNPENIQTQSAQTASTSGVEPTSYPLAIVLNELLPSPEGSDEQLEWFELFNQNNFLVDLSGWQIKDIAGSVKTYTLQKGTTMGSRSYLVVFRPTSKITLNNDSDGLVLLNPAGETADGVSYDKAPTNQSYNRTEDEWQWSDKPSPGSINTISGDKITQNISKDAEEKSASQKEQLTASAESIPLTTGESSAQGLYPFLIAAGLAVLAGITMLLLKRKFIPE